MERWTLTMSRCRRYSYWAASWFAGLRCAVFPSLSEKTLSSGRKLTERFLLSLVALGSLMVALSSGVNAILLHDARRSPHPEPSIRSTAAACVCTAWEAAPPPSFWIQGLGNDGLIWGGLQPVLAKTTQVCSYDRAGYGWSDPGPAPRDANSIADDLHALLGAAHIDGPLVLMGHSISGIYIRAFATRYPQHLAGLIFVDGSTPWQNRNPAFHAEMAHAIPNGYTTLRNRLIFAMGIPTPLWGMCRQPFSWFRRSDGKAGRRIPVPSGSRGYCRRGRELRPLRNRKRSIQAPMEICRS